MTYRGGVTPAGEDAVAYLLVSREQLPWMESSKGGNDGRGFSGEAQRCK
jgi:hypothetical protein